MKKRVLGLESDRKNVSKETLDGYIATLKRMVDCKTVFDSELTNKSEYERFYKVLEEEFPLLCERAEKLVFGTGCFIFKIEGENSSKRVLLMSHHDVVDGDERWETDPFNAVIKDGNLYGRGTIDTKTPLFAELQAVEELLKEGYDFSGMTLYIGSSNNEETSGDGMVLAANYFRENGIKFDVILDEGGAITSGQIPGVKGKSAVVAVHEKSRHLYRCSAKLITSGHGGLGGKQDSVVERLTAFMDEVKRSNIYKGDFAPEVKATFEGHAPYMSFPYGLLFGNISLFSPLIKKIMMGIPAASAMLSTSIAFTNISAVHPEGDHLRADSGYTTLYLRCVREDDLYKGLEKIKAIAQKYGVEIEEILRDYCEPTDFNCDAFKTLEEVVIGNFPDVIVTPFLLTAGTDARRFTGLSDAILRFAPIDLSKEQFKTIHGANENIGIENVGQCVLFYKDIIKKYNK